MYAEITKSIEHSVETDIFQANTPLGIITEKAVAMKARSAKRTTVKKLVNQLSVTQTTKTSLELNNTENTRKKRATTVNGLSMEHTPEMIQEEKVKTDYVQNNCSPKFFSWVKQNGRKLVIYVIYLSWSTAVHMDNRDNIDNMFAEKLDQISTIKYLQIWK